MTDIPIIFKDEMVRAILSGYKRITRRPVVLSHSNYPMPSWWYDGSAFLDCNGEVIAKEPHCPWGNPDDVLWVRETYHTIANSALGVAFIYRANMMRYQWVEGDGLPATCNKEPCIYNGPWTPSIHMPRSACRLLLRRTESAIIERVITITGYEAQLEGFESRRAFLDWWFKQYPTAHYCWRIPFKRKG